MINYLSAEDRDLRGVYGLVVCVPPDLKFSDSVYLLFGASILRDDIVVFKAYPFKKYTILTNPKLYPMDVASIVTGPINLQKRYQKEKDLELTINMEDIKEACKKFGLTYST